MPHGKGCRARLIPPNLPLHVLTSINYRNGPLSECIDSEGVPLLGGWSNSATGVRISRNCFERQAVNHNRGRASGLESLSAPSHQARALGFPGDSARKPHTFSGRALMPDKSLLGEAVVKVRICSTFRRQPPSAQSMHVDISGSINISSASSVDARRWALRLAFLKKLCPKASTREGITLRRKSFLLKRGSRFVGSSHQSIPILRAQLCTD